MEVKVSGYYVIVLVDQLVKEGGGVIVVNVCGGGSRGYIAICDT